MTAMDWTTFVIAVASLFLSILIWIKDLVSQRRKLLGRILVIESYADCIFFDLLLENRSRLPIAITQIELFINGKYNLCSQIPKIVSEHTRKKGHDVIERITKRSVQLPIQISGLGANESIILFENLKESLSIDATNLTIRVSTNRGRPFEMILPLPEDWIYQRKIP